MRSTLKILCAASAVTIVMAGPAAAQDAKTLLRAADQAVGASKVNSVQFTGKGRFAYLGQNFTTNDDWNRVDLSNYTLTIDYPSKVIQGRTGPRSG